MTVPQSLDVALDEIARLAMYIERLHGRVTSARRRLRAAREELTALKRQLAAGAGESKE